MVPLLKPSQDKLSISSKLFYLHKTLKLFQIDQSCIRRHDTSLPAVFLELLHLAYGFSLLFVQPRQEKLVIGCSHFLSHFTPSLNQTRSLPLSVQEQTNSVMWKSVFGWELFPSSTRSYCAVMVLLCVFDSSVLFFCLNWKFL